MNGGLVPDRYPLFKQPQTPARHRRPAFVVGQWHGGNHCDAIVRSCDIAEIDTQILITQVCNGKRRLPNDVAEQGRTVREQAVAVG